MTETLDLALEASGCDRATVIAKPRLLSDNGSSYIAGDLADYLDDKGMDLSATRRSNHRRKVKVNAGIKP